MALRSHHEVELKRQPRVDTSISAFAASREGKKNQGLNHMAVEQKDLF